MTDIAEWLLAQYDADAKRVRALSGGTVVGKRGNWSAASGGDEWVASHNPGLEVEVLVALRPGLPQPPDLTSGLYGQVTVWKDSDCDYAGDPGEWLSRDCLPIAEHIARHDPAAVLADLAAKRRIVEEYREWVGGTSPDPRDAEREVALRFVVRLLALPLADREGYDPAWAPNS